MIDNQRAALRYQNKVNNAQGHFFESTIKAACALYSDRERADVDKPLNRSAFWKRAATESSRAALPPAHSRTFKERLTAGAP